MTRNLVCDMVLWWRRFNQQAGHLVIDLRRAATTGLELVSDDDFGQWLAGSEANGLAFYHSRRRGSICILIVEQENKHWAGGKRIQACVIGNLKWQERGWRRSKKGYLDSCTAAAGYLLAWWLITIRLTGGVQSKVHSIARMMAVMWCRFAFDDHGRLFLGLAVHHAGRPTERGPRIKRVIELSRGQYINKSLRPRTPYRLVAGYIPAEIPVPSIIRPGSCDYDTLSRL